MSRGLVFALLLATLCVLAQSRHTIPLEDNLQLQFAIDWYKAQTCGSPFLYDENFEGPGNLPANFTAAAQTIANNLLAGGPGSDNTDVAAIITANTQGCNFHEFISQVTLSSVGVNVHDDIVNIQYSGPLVEISRTLLNNAEFNRIRRCPAYDNYAFGLRIDNTTSPDTIHFVILAVASNPASLCSGTTTLTSTSDYLCGSNCGTIEGTTGDVTFIPTPTEVAEGILESDDDVLIWKESDQVIDDDLTIDLYALNSNGSITFNTPRGGNLEAVTPDDGDASATIVAGTHVISWFLKFDPLGSANPTPQQVSGSVIFANPIIGAIFTQQRPTGSRNRLSETDPTFATLCVGPYNTNINNPLIWRGIEYSTRLNTAESFTIHDNVFTINDFQAKERAVDNVRIFTTCPRGPACDVGVVVSTNIRQIPPPIRITPGFLQSNTEVFLFRERRWLLSRAISVDYIVPAYPDNYNILAPTATDPQFPAGTAVTSWYFHAETIGATFTNYTASATFKDQIKAFIFRAVNPPQNAGHETLRATDSLFGDHCTAYQPGFESPQTFRGLEFTTADSLNVDATGYRLDFVLRVTRGQDDFRVLTECDT